MPDQNQLSTELKEMICRRLMLRIQPEEIGDDQPLFGADEGSLGLDSIEALEMAVGIEHTFGVPVGEGQEVVEQFYSVRTLSAFIAKLQAEKAAQGSP